MRLRARAVSNPLRLPSLRVPNSVNGCLAVDFMGKDERLAGAIGRPALLTNPTTDTRARRRALENATSLRRAKRCEPRRLAFRGGTLQHRGKIAPAVSSLRGGCGRGTSRSAVQRTELERGSTVQALPHCLGQRLGFERLLQETHPLGSVEVSLGQIEAVAAGAKDL